MASLMPIAKQQYFDSNGVPLSGGKVYTYAAGTTTPLATYTDSGGSTPNANPVVLDSRGEASIFFSAASYKIVLKDSADVTIWTADNLAGDAAASALAALAASGGSALVGFLQSGTGAVATTVQTKLRESVSVGDYGIVSDGTTDQTSALVSLMSTLSGSGYRGWIYVPYNTKFTVSTVYAAVPVGVILDDESSINWGQPPGYKNRFKVMYSGDSAADDTQEVIASGHHPAISLLNTGTSGSASGTGRYASIMQGVNIRYNNDMVYGWMQTFQKASVDNVWQVNFRLQTPYLVAMGNPSPWVTATVYAANAYCISDSGKVYTTTAGGTSGGTAPTGTGAGINDGGVLWNYVQSNVNLDASTFYFDENGNFNFSGLTGTPRLTQLAGAKKHYFQINSSTGDISWVDNARGTIVSVTDTNGTQFSVGQSANRQTMTGTGPTASVTGYGKVANGGATNMSTVVPVSGRSRMILNLRFDDANTTVVHGTGANALTLKGAVNATPGEGKFMTFEYDSSLSARWFEVSRSF